MTSEPPLAPLDLLVVGGLTVDRFGDGRSAAGGAVLYAALAARDAGLRVGVVIAAGAEPEADAALRDLAALPYLVVQRAQSSIGFAHGVRDGRRELVLLDPGHRLEAGASVEVPAAAVLYASVAAEIPTGLVTWPRADALRGAILQGWLRRLERGRPVRPRGIDALGRAQASALARLDLLVASRDDLDAASDAPGRELDALRLAVGPRPVLVLTDGAAGAWVDLPPGSGPGTRWHQPVPRLVEAVDTVGAGDMLAALLMSVPWPRPPAAGWLRRRMEDAMLRVAERLELRR